MVVQLLYTLFLRRYAPFPLSMMGAVRKNSPQVTGISPKEGPPGTRVTIRGEYLGRDANDLIGVKICGVNCILTCEWKSPNKIITRTGDAKGKGDIVVVTASGGVGTSTVQFRGCVQQTGPLQESAVWVDEGQTWASMIQRHRITSPMTVDLDDPLGISDEACDAKFSGDLHEMFPGGCGNTQDENFVPAWYLLENHHGTSFEDLKAGLAHLKRKSTQSNEGPLAFVKGNLNTFMDSQDALSGMHLTLVQDQCATPSGRITQILEDILIRANRCAGLLFQDVLGRKDRADATRNALSVLQRFRFLFNLPCSIDRNIKREDYDLVITDYMRAKSLFGESEVPVFRKVYAEVEQRICDFREMLHNRLLQLPAPLEDQRRFIRYLVNLEAPGDPAWECLEQELAWLQNLLHNCKDRHLGKSVEDSVDDCSTKPRVPQKVEFVEDLAKTLSDNLPNFWRLGQVYLSGKLSCKDSKDQSSRADQSKSTKLRNMLECVVHLFCNLLRAAFLPESLAEVAEAERKLLGAWREARGEAASGWLPVAVRHVRACVLLLAGIDMPPDAMTTLQTLVGDMRLACISNLLTQAKHDIRDLSTRETWQVEPHDEYGGTTLLPALMENMLSETIQHLHEVVTPRAGETELFAEQHVQSLISNLLLDVLKAFASLLDNLAIVGNEERDSEQTHRTSVRPDLSETSELYSMPSLDKRLMIMLSNCHHTREVILPRIAENLEKHEYPCVPDIMKDAEATFKQLDMKLFERYVEEKSNPIVGKLEDDMYTGRFDWNDCMQSNGVRRYLKEALRGMIAIHAEVYAVSPASAPRLLARVVHGVVDELSRLVQCVTGFNRNGALQARLELYALELAVAAYRSEATQQAFADAAHCLPELISEDDKHLLEELLNTFQRHMRLQLLCFQPDAGRPS